MSDFATADLYDAHGDALQVAQPGLRSFGGHAKFKGPIQTVKVFEDNSLVKEQLSTPGNGRVLVVDGAGSLRCALLGDRLAGLGVDNGWAGVVIHGCVRDVKILRSMPIGVLALGAIPRKSVKRDSGVVGCTVDFLDACFTPGHLLYADEDGVVVLDGAGA